MEEFEIQYGGKVDGISIELDMNSRSKVMRVIDSARAKGQVLRLQPYQSSALLRLSHSGFKIVTNDENEDILERMPLHQVASVSYLCEDDQHIIVIKYGEVDSKKNYNMECDEDLVCYMVVSFCENKKTAVNLCNSMEQYFEDTLSRERTSTFSQFNGINDKDRTGHHDNEKDDADTNLTQPNYSFLSNSCKDLSNTFDPSTTKRTSIDSHDSSYVELAQTSSSQLSDIEQKLIMDYMKKLYNILDTRELEEFAKLVKAWHNDLTFNEFCSRLLVLYGPEKKCLLSEMRPFIPAKDYPAFEVFLKNYVYGDTDPSGK